MLKISNVIKGWKVFLGNNWKCLTTTTEHLTNLQNWFITWTHFSSVRVICYFRKCSRPGNWREQQRSVVYSTEWLDSLLDNLVHGFVMIGWITLGLSLSIARTLTIILCEVGKHYKQGGDQNTVGVRGRNESRGFLAQIRVEREQAEEKFMGKFSRIGENRFVLP